MAISFKAVIYVMPLMAMANTVSFTGVVVDAENGQPIQGAKATAYYQNYSRVLGGGSKTVRCSRCSDEEGRVAFSGKTDRGECSWCVEAEGHYRAFGDRPPIDKRSVASFRRLFCASPVVTARLDRVINPIPLFVKEIKGVALRKDCHIRNSAYSIDSDFEDLVTTNRSSFAFDLVDGDWLPPFGKGHYADITVFCRKEILGHEMFDGPIGLGIIDLCRFNADIRFNGESNGLCQMKIEANSYLKIRTAPESGYMPNIQRNKGRIALRKYVDDSDKNRNYCFRIRTHHDENGRIVSALYGKIYGDFRVNDAKGVGFLYYLNPTPNDRNLEWDMKNNLCPKQSDSIRREP